MYSSLPSKIKGQLHHAVICHHLSMSSFLECDLISSLDLKAWKSLPTVAFSSNVVFPSDLETWV